MNTSDLSYKKLIEKYVLPLILLLWPLININMGTSFADTSYSLANYMFFKEMTGSWKYATFVANFIGYIFNSISDGRLIIMNILTGLIVSAIALIVYFGLKREIGSVILFISLLLAEGLCWCPSVIMYHYLTYLCLTAATVLLYKAITSNNKILYYCAGVILGISFFVRISNAVQVLLIFAVWVGVYLYKGKGKKAKWIKPTFLCIGGYITGAMLIIIIMLLTSGAAGMLDAFNWAIGLFTASEDKGGYSAGSMIINIISYYVKYAKWFAAMVVGIVFGVAGFYIFKDKFLRIKKIGYTFCVFILFFWFYRNGVFNANYRNTGAIFGISVIFILCQFVLLFYTVLDKNTNRNERLLAFFAVIILLITPLGSNNHIFTIINNMFFTLPISVFVFLQLIKEYIKEPLIFPLYSMMSVLFIVFFIESVFFHLNYTFKDGEDGKPRDTVIAANCVMDGIHTVNAHARMIEEIVKLDDNGMVSNSSGLILFGDIPGASYLLRKNAAISTSWPDLASYSTQSLKSDMEKLNSENKAVVIINNEFLNNYYNENMADKDLHDKLVIILEYANKLENSFEGEYVTAYF